MRGRRRSHRGIARARAATSTYYPDRSRTMLKTAATLALITGWLLAAATGSAHGEPAGAPPTRAGAVRGESDVPVTPAQLKTAKIRELSGKHLTLYTDLPAGSGVDPLVAAFDQAYPQWCAYFGVAEARTPPGRATVCLMGDKSRFLAAGLLPADLPAFDHAYFRGKAHLDP